MTTHTLPTGQIVGQKFRIPAATEYEYDGSDWSKTKSAPSLYKQTNAPSEHLEDGDIWIDDSGNMLNYNGSSWDSVAGDKNPEWIIESNIQTTIDLNSSSWYMYTASAETTTINMPTPANEGDELRFAYKGSFLFATIDSGNGTFYVNGYDTDSTQYQIRSGNSIEAFYAGGHWNIKDSDTNAIEQSTGKAWSVITTSGTAAAGDKCLIDTTLNPITITLPASPNTGDTINLAPLKGTYFQNNLIINNNGNLINEVNDTIVVNEINLSLELRFVGGVVGWLLFDRGETTVINVFTGKMEGLSIYSDNASAISSGLTAGDVYRTNDGTIKVVY